MRGCLRLATFVAAFVLALCVLFPSTARAQEAPSEIEVRVTDAAGKPLADARVFISGSLTTSALTPRDGRVRFTDVEPGLYRLRIALAGYAGVDVDDVEALAGRRKVVEVTLERPQPKSPAPGATTPPAIADGDRPRRARPAVTVTSIDVDEGNPVRRVSENLADALDKIAGISVTPRSAARNAVDLAAQRRRVAHDRERRRRAAARRRGERAAIRRRGSSTGVSADSGGGLGGSGVGGAVNFRTLEPTKTWQEQMSASYGGYERSSLQFALSGSYKKLGVALQHAVRGGDSVLTGLRFEDTSGQNTCTTGRSTAPAIS